MSLVPNGPFTSESRSWPRQRVTGELLLESVKVGSDVPRIARRHTHVWHRRLGIDARRILDPTNHVVRLIWQNAGDENATGNLSKRRTNKPVSAGDAGDRVAGSTTVFGNRSTT